MDGEIVERIANRVLNVILIGVFSIVMVKVPESLPWCTGTIGVLLGQIMGASVADRVKRRTIDKIAKSIAPPALSEEPIKRDNQTR